MRILVATLLFVGCLCCIAASASAGLSRLITNEAITSNRIEAVNIAVRLAPFDPLGYDIRGTLLTNSEQFESAINDFQHAIAQSPKDYLLWIKLGLARERSRDFSGAVEAFVVSARLAPHYAAPHWYLGNVLVNEGHVDEGFLELRRAAQSDPSLLPSVVEKAWSAYRGEAKEVMRVVEPQTNAARLSLARFFVSKGSVPEALELLAAAGNDTDQDRHEMIVQLVEAHRYRDASIVWRTGEGAKSDALITDGSFETGKTSQAPGFLWQLAPPKNGVKVSIDNQNPKEGQNCLRLDLSGVGSTDIDFAKQLVVLEPNARYRLTFAARTEALSGDAMPIVTVLDAGTFSPLAISKSLNEGDNMWQDIATEFSTSEVTEAVYIIIQRQKCTTDLCPIFGRVWFDEFSLNKLNRA